MSSQQIQTEVQELRKRIRILENDKKAYEDESAQMLKRQANLINKLKDENKSLCTQMVDNSKKQKQINQAKKTMDVVQGEIQVLKDKIDNEINTQKEYDDEIKMIQKQSIEAKRSINNTSATQKNHDSASQHNKTNQAKQIKILENRLDKANQRFNDLIAQNKKTREEIDNIRKEKAIFEGVYSKLEKQLAGKRKNIAQIIEAANFAYEERD